MKILTPGKLQPTAAPVWRGRCHACGCEIECYDSECELAASSHNGQRLRRYPACPTAGCGLPMLLYPACAHAAAQAGPPKPVSAPAVVFYAF